MSTSRILLAAALVVTLTAAPALSFTLVFRDGSTLVVEDRYRIEGERLYATLLSGTETFFDLADVDLERTEEMNEMELGSAFVLDANGRRQRSPQANAEPQTLRQLLRERGDTTDSGIFSKPNATAEARITPAGNLDLFTVPRAELEPAEAAERVTRILRRNGVNGQVRAGSGEGRVLVEVITDARSQVFAALSGAAAAMPEIVAELPQVEVLELTMETQARRRAAMFALELNQANALNRGEIEPERFFFENVLF
ncbi:MAG: hypothetical protein R3190_10730 [Thermoanaerobaculia bacterium]|nr:hypothetical protein [Thermoanaerobaculia bacterium]